MMSVTRLVITVSLIVLYLGNCTALYEDQIGKFDWKKEYIGEVDNVVFDASISVSRHVFVSTLKNIIACINARTGLVVWRKVFEDNDGKVVFMKHMKEGLLTVTSHGIARFWDSATGMLKWDADFGSVAEKGDGFSVIDVGYMERSYSEGNLITVLSPIGIHSVSMLTTRKKSVIQTASLELSSKDILNNQLYVDSSDGKIIHIQLQSGARLLSTIYTASDMEILTQVDINISWLDNLNTATLLEDATLFYLSNDAGSVHLVDPENGKAKFSATLSSFDIDSPISSVISVENKDIKSRGFEVMLFHNDGKASLLKIDDSGNNVKLLWTKEFPGLFSIKMIQRGNEKYSFISQATDSGVVTRAVNMKTGNFADDITVKYKPPKHSASLKKVFHDMFLKKNTPIGFRSLLTFADHSAVQVSYPNKAMWHRDEALASVVDAAMLDLPLSDVDAGIEAEFEEPGKTNILGMFAKRVKAQGNMLVSWMKQFVKDFKSDNLLRGKTRDPLIQVEGLTRDPFSLHKMIVLVTDCGAVFGVDSLTGDIVWRYYSENLQDRKVRFYVQRTTAHFPHPPQALILALDKKHQRDPVAISINPITGTAIDISNSLSDVSSSILQVILSPVLDSQYIRPVIILDSELKLHYIPDSVEIRNTVNEGKFFIYDVNINNGVIRGFIVSDSSSAEEVWSMSIMKSHKIVGFASKQPFEKVDSQGRPLADRSVIYKYLNPNLIAILSESLDKSVDRSSLLLYVVDAVTGQVIHSVIHKKSSGPVHIVHSENWLIYSYWNTKARRNELASIEFYEGKTQFNDTAFSSFHQRPRPMVVQQAYIFPSGIASMGATRTEKGLTSRQILFGLQRGAIFGMPRRYFDPRRPLTLTESHREEGLVPYMPEVPLPPELFLSYNHTIEKISNIYTTSAALESTSVILVTGLDIFFTRSQPSKMFDVLKEDFDHLFITAVLILMLLGALVTRRMAQVKQLKKSWR